MTGRRRGVHGTSRHHLRSRGGLRGATVAVAMLSLLVLRVAFLTGVGFAAAVTVTFAVAAAVTLLPALFRVLGVRGSQPTRTPTAPGPAAPLGLSGWARWADVVRRHPGSLGGRGAVDDGAPRDPDDSVCGWVRPTKATTRPPPRHARPTTCWPTASVPATTVRCSSSRHDRPPRAARSPPSRPRWSRLPGVASTASRPAQRFRRSDCST